MGWIEVILGFVLFIIGLSMIIGFGWTLIIIDLLTQASTGDYYSAQQTYKGAKAPWLKLLGLIIVITGIIVFIYGASRL